MAEAHSLFLRTSFFYFPQSSVPLSDAQFALQRPKGQITNEFLRPNLILSQNLLIYVLIILEHFMSRHLYTYIIEVPVNELIILSGSEICFWA